MILRVTRRVQGFDVQIANRERVVVLELRGARREWRESAQFISRRRRTSAERKAYEVSRPGGFVRASVDFSIRVTLKERLIAPGMVIVVMPARRSFSLVSLGFLSRQSRLVALTLT